MADTTIHSPATPPTSGPTRAIIGLPVQFEFAPEKRNIQEQYSLQARVPGGRSLTDVLSPNPGVQWEAIVVRVNGKCLDVPYDSVAEARNEAQMELDTIHHSDGESPSALAAFVEATYLFGGWARIASFQWQLDWLPDALIDVPITAHRFSRNPPPRDVVETMAGLGHASSLLPGLPRPEDTVLTRTPDYDTWAFDLARYLRDLAAASWDAAPSPTRRDAAIARAHRLALAFRIEVNRLRDRIYTELSRVEAAARTAGLARLERSRKQVLSQGWRLLGQVNGKTFEQWCDPQLLLPGLVAPPTDDFKDFEDVVRVLDPLARRVSEAEEQLFSKVFDKRFLAALQSARTGLGQPGPIEFKGAMAAVSFLQQVYELEQTEEIERLRKELSDAQVALAKLLTAASFRFPVLLRYSPFDLINIDEPAVPDYRRRLPYYKLMKALNAVDNMTARLRRKPLSGNPQPTPSDRDLEEALAMCVEDSVWDYRKVILDGVASLFLPSESLAAVATQNLLKAIERRESEQERLITATAVVESAVTMSVTVFCPPAGLALDLAFGVADAIMALSVYDRQSDEYYASLNPADSLADLEPSMVPVAVAFGGIVLSVAFP